MSKKTSSVSAIDHFFHQRKDTFQIIGHYGLFWIRIVWVLLLIIVPLMIANAVEDLVFGKVPSVKSLHALIELVAVFILSGLFRRYVKGDVFSMKNTGSLVALGTFHCIVMGAPVLGTLLLAVAVVVPSRDVDTPKADA